MIKFKQLIREGNKGRDVKATKIALERMGFTNIHIDKFAGTEWVKAVKAVQQHHGLKPDGIYGKATHAKIAINFTPYCVWLYKTSVLRKPKHPPIPQTAVAAAKRLVVLYNQGKVVDERGGSVIFQLRRTADGFGVWSPIGHYVSLNAKLLETLVWLVDEKGFTLGITALCSDHPFDTPFGHSAGRCVDIGVINGKNILYSGVKPILIKFLETLNEQSKYRPWQLISGGFAEHRDSQCTSLCIPGGDWFYTTPVMAQHTNHVHVGD